MSDQSAASAFSSSAAPSTMTIPAFQATFDQIVEERPPGLLTLSTMFLTASSTFWPLPDAQRHEKRNRRRLLVEPNAHDRAVEDEPDDRLVLQGARGPGVPVTFHLAPGPANHIFAHSAFENCRKRTAHTARVGPGQIGARDQSFGLFRAPLIGPQRFALPLRRLAVFTDDPGTRDGDLGGPNVPVSDRIRCPCRWPTIGAAALSAAVSSSRRP